MSDDIRSINLFLQQAHDLNTIWEPIKQNGQRLTMEDDKIMPIAFKILINSAFIKDIGTKEAFALRKELLTSQRGSIEAIEHVVRAVNSSADKVMKQRDMGTLTEGMNTELANQNLRFDPETGELVQIDENESKELIDKNEKFGKETKDRPNTESDNSEEFF